MKQPEFEKRVLEIWVRSRVPLTAAHVQHLTGAPRAKVKKWLDAMAIEGALEVDVDDDGEMTWKVRGAERAASGPATVAELERFERLASEVGVGGAERALSRGSRATGLAPNGGADRKSVVASGVLSLVLGPFGWLYAAPLRESVPAVIALCVAASFVPRLLLTPLFAIVFPLSGLAGVYYALRHNQTGERSGLFSDRK
jgi:hypothetical protein